MRFRDDPSARDLRYVYGTRRSGSNPEAPAIPEPVVGGLSFWAVAREDRNGKPPDGTSGAARRATDTGVGDGGGDSRLSPSGRATRGGGPRSGAGARGAGRRGATGRWRASVLPGHPKGALDSASAAAGADDDDGDDDETNDGDGGSGDTDYVRCPVGPTGFNGSPWRWEEALFSFT